MACKHTHTRTRARARSRSRAAAHSDARAPAPSAAFVFVECESLKRDFICVASQQRVCSLARSRFPSFYFDYIFVAFSVRLEFVCLGWLGAVRRGRPERICGERKRASGDPAHDGASECGARCRYAARGMAQARTRAKASLRMRATAPRPPQPNHHEHSIYFFNAGLEAKCNVLLFSFQSAFLPHFGIRFHDAILYHVALIALPLSRPVVRGIRRVKRSALLRKKQQQQSASIAARSLSPRMGPPNGFADSIQHSFHWRNRFGCGDVSPSFVHRTALSIPFGTLALGAALLSIASADLNTRR